MKDCVLEIFFYLHVSQDKINDLAAFLSNFEGNNGGNDQLLWPSFLSGIIYPNIEEYHSSAYLLASMALYFYAGE